jgi:hypothetical protein
MSSGVTGVPVSYEVEGRQFIAVQWDGAWFGPHAGAPQLALSRQVSGCPAGRCGLGIRREIERQNHHSLSELGSCQGNALSGAGR